MNKYTIIALVTLFVTNFTLFLGWVPIGVMIPQTLFIIATIIVQSRLLVSKSLLFCLLFFIYQVISGLFYGKGFDITGLASQFYGMAIPLIISTFLFDPNHHRDCRGVSKYALIVSFVTMLLSIRVLLFNGSALRVTSMANSTGDWSTLYSYWRQGMADYAMAAMMLFMPGVLIHYSRFYKKKWSFPVIAGIIISFAFLYLGQVTTPFVLGILIAVMSLLNLKNRSVAIVGIGMVLLMIVTQFTGLLDFAISHTSGSAMNERFSSMAAVVNGEELDETSDVSVRWALIGLSVKAFISNPLFGNCAAEIGGHNFFLDSLARYGIIGCIPFFLLIKSQYNIISSVLSDNTKRYYLIILFGFITLGILKNMSGTEYWNYLFIYYPALLVWFDNIQKKKEHLIMQK